MTETEASGLSLVGKQRFTACLTLISGACLIFGSFLPWLHAQAPLVGNVTRTGLDGATDGWISLGLGFALGLMGLRLVFGIESRSAARFGMTVFAAGAAAVAFSIYEIVHVNNRLDAIRSSDAVIIAGIGAGLYVILLGGATALVAGGAAWQVLVAGVGRWRPTRRLVIVGLTVAVIVPGLAGGGYLLFRQVRWHGYGSAWDCVEGISVTNREYTLPGGIEHLARDCHSSADDARVQVNFLQSNPNAFEGD